MAIEVDESTWADFKKKHKLKKVDLGDKGLVKALEAFDKVEAVELERRRSSLEDVTKQLKLQLRELVKRKHTKELDEEAFEASEDMVYEFLKGAEAIEKDLTREIIDKARAEAKAKAEAAAADKAKAKAERKASATDDDEDDDDEETPALLTDKMKPLIKAIRKGSVVMPALIARTSSEMWVLISRRAISPARGKLLKAQMVDPSGLKFIRGECCYEQGALTFVVQSPAAALAKRLRVAVLAQTGLRMKVKVRGEDQSEEEDDD